MDDFDAIKARLDDYGVRMEIDAIATIESEMGQLRVSLNRGASRQSYAVLHGPDVRLNDVARSMERSVGPVMVWTPFVRPKTADGFRRANIQYIDNVGNAWLTFNDVLIDVRGRTPTNEARRPSHTSGNLFSAGRAQVVFALLAWPQLRRGTTRELAEAAGVSVGLAHGTLDLLRQTGYGDATAPHESRALLDHWAASFPTGLAPRLLLGSFRSDPERIDEVRKYRPDDEMFISGEAATDELRGTVRLILYVDELHPGLPIANRWRADGAHNVVVRRKFWQAPDGSDGPIAGVHLAPGPLVYADLMSSDDPRIRTVAQEWGRRLAGHA
ncbi:hypothetical protein F0U44_13710 [Nocardioides humilatus]|uniref:Uncharacterized protein n=1 Tax=Nocardioides humilatus TaxID=2607660 RepID=A0A5B1LFE7_9ACTN|nr:type IV toxin-antitoxin system AbiEi family antitoxin [Nocardioides humilatus]KAA1419481.1 hypothetical protein F0U44_13710 [Nocardioides humilatus]